FLGVEHPQKLRLEIHRELSNLIKKKGSGIRLLKHSLMSCIGTRECPRSCPKSSLSARVVVRAPQLTARNGRLQRGPLKWMARATSSFPLPLSPNSRTVLLESVTRLILSKTARMATLCPIKLSK